MKQSTADVDALLAASRAGERRARDELLLIYRPMVDLLAGKMIAGLPPSVERDDLAGYGIFGLISAIELYDPELNKNFEAYATDRVKGAILDGLRKHEWAPEKLRRRVRGVDRARAELEASNRRSVSDAEVAEHLGVDVKRVSRLLGDAARATPIPLDETVFESGELTVDVVAPVLVDVDQLRDHLAEAIVSLPERERVVFTLYYFEEVTFEVIGEYLGVSKPRVSAIRDDAVMRVRASLAGRA